MGWFSADEIVAPTSSSVEGGHHTAQTVALCVLAAVAVGCLLVKSIAKIQRQHTERVAEQTARRVALPV